ncbi:cytochrome P450 [Rhodobacteraceae bacterium 2CG4]|uniref:Cytochrome P450 n=1 Tax=Halovulum marinum TaxID=2662447 RepID=A0A6L5Z642_9RHOB|nr:cytochrome P450 [Halovulum marinum]MSU91452.1 cytochrome P450 [Halovulum marinum]
MDDSTEPRGDEARIERVLFRPAAPVPTQGAVSWPALVRGLLRSDFSHFPAAAYTTRVYRIPVRGRTLLMPSGPAQVREVLVSEHDNYPKSRVMQRILGPLIGNSMFVTNGDVWRRQRRMIDPTLELSRLKAFLPLMQGAVDDMVARMGQGGEMDLDQETMRVAADILCRCVFSEQVQPGMVDELAETFRRYQALVPAFLALEGLGQPRWVLPLRQLRARRAGNRIRGRMAALIRQRLDSGARPEDLLTGLIEARDPQTGHRFTETELVDEVVFFFLAGHETSASALSWSLYLLANDPQAQERARAEVLRELGPAQADFSGLRRLRFTRDVFREALRLYPPVTAYIRDALGTARLAKRDVRAGDLVSVTPWFVHRSPRNWSHPDLFDPDRFQTEAGRASMREAYVPFNTGPRVCSGAAFATQESLLVLAAVLGRYRLHPVPGRAPQPAAWLTQRSRNGTWLRLEPLSRRTGRDQSRNTS